MAAPGPGRGPRKPRSAMSILRMTDLDLAGKRVLVREDLNVPIDDQGRITSELRIEAAFPTLRRAGAGRGADGDVAPGTAEGRAVQRGRLAGPGGEAPGRAARAGGAAGARLPRRRRGRARADRAARELPHERRREGRRRGARRE